MSKKESVDAASMHPIVRRSFVVGDCIILNDVEQPCGKMICVITAKVGDRYECKYLNAGPMFDQFNEPPMRNTMDRATLIEDFGVVLRFKGSQYWCDVVGESRATYPNGKPRKWQEHGGPYYYYFRDEVADCVRPF